MPKSGKQKAMERANKSLQERVLREQGISEGQSAGVNTPIVILKDELKGAKAVIKQIKYFAELQNGDIVSLAEGEFYNDTDPDLPF